MKTILVFLCSAAAAIAADTTPTPTPVADASLSDFTKTIAGITESSVHKDTGALTNLDIAMARKFGPPPSIMIHRLAHDVNPFFQRSSSVSTKPLEGHAVDPREPIMKMPITAFSYSEAGDSYIVLGGDVVSVGDELSPGLGSIKVIGITKKEITFEMKTVDGVAQTFSRTIPDDLLP